MQKTVSTMNDLKKDYDIRITNLEEKIKRDYDGRLKQVESTFYTVNENLISLVTYIFTKL